jgi:hypothetical protein
MLTPVLSDEQRAQFWLTGIVKLEGAFSAAQAARMQDVLWEELSRRYGIDRADASTWDRHPPTGLKTSKKSRVFAPILGPAVTAAFDQLFAPAAWVPPKHSGQVLVTMPVRESEWRVPFHLWHADFQYYAPFRPLFALKYWALFGDVEAGGGGTLQLAGSHRLVEQYLEGVPPEEREYKRVRDGFLRSHPWLRALSTADDDPDRNARFMGGDADIDGLPARVVECTGRAGDVYLTHPWVMHCIAPNARSEPRLMKTGAIYRAASVEDVHRARDHEDREDE